MERVAKQFSKVNIVRSPKTSSKSVSNSQKRPEQDHEKLQLSEALQKNEVLLNEARQNIQANEAELEQIKNERDDALAMIQQKDAVLSQLSAEKNSAVFQLQRAESQLVVRNIVHACLH